MLSRRFLTVLALLPFASASAAGCDDAEAPPVDPVTGEPFEELPVGEVEGAKEDGAWGAATTCKAIPVLPVLADPEIVVSLEGLTLHLRDRAGSYDKVFPIGPGAIKDGLSLTPVSTNLPTGTFTTRTDLAPVSDGPTPAQAAWGWNYKCRMWWTNETNEKSPVFAGLPFIRLQGPASSAYGIHGPIDNYTLPSGGKLRRGFVSHGCVRMEAADLVEVYARIAGKKVPVRVQKAVERRDDGRAVDVPVPWVMSECSSDADCGFQGGFCKANAYSGRGFCTTRCNRYCTDKAGFPPTFCVADPTVAGQGLCVAQPQLWTDGCRRYDGFVSKRAPRFGQTSTIKDACVPGSEGWIGDRCLAAGDCLARQCVAAGDGAKICTEPCTRYCPDKNASYASTFCVAADPATGLTGGMCTAQCFSNDDCPLGTTCEDEVRFGQASVVRKACLPY